MYRQLTMWLRYARTVYHSNVETAEWGQGLVEYAMILVFVSVVMVVLLVILGPGIGNLYSNIVAALQPDSGG